MTRSACWFVVAVLLTAACAFTESRDQAQVLTERYFEAAQRGDSEAVLAMYGEKFYEVTPKEKWRSMYSALVGKLGRPQKHELPKWFVNKNASTSGSGSYVTLTYNVTYSGGSGIETLIVFIPSGSGQASLVGHNFNSDGLLK